MPLLICDFFSSLLHRFALFRFAGTIGVVDISRFASYGYDQRLEVFGPGGMLQVANDNPNTSIRYTDEGISRLVWVFRVRVAAGSLKSQYFRLSV